MANRRCFFQDKTKRGTGSPDCYPGTFATHIVRRYFINPRPAPLCLCRAHAEYHAHLNPEFIQKKAPR